MAKRRWFDRVDLVINGLAGTVGFGVGFYTGLSLGEPGTAFFFALACGVAGAVVAVLLANGFAQVFDFR